MKPEDIRVLVACEFSEVVKEQFLLRGFDAHSCDLLPGEKGLPNHHQCDVREILNDGWDLMIAHPPCTYLCNSGVRWFVEQPDRYSKVVEAAEFFDDLLHAHIWHIAVENPIHHHFARTYIRPYDQIVQPYYFGDKERKATCFWLKNLPPLMPQFSGGEGIKQSVFHEAPSPDRWKNRSRTFHGIAVAMAEQWGSFLIKELSK